jgi:Mannosyltransferase (PIG-V)
MQSDGQAGDSTQSDGQAGDSPISRAHAPSGDVHAPTARATAHSGRTGGTARRAVARLGEERLWLLRWTLIGFAVNKVLVLTAAWFGMQTRFEAQTEYGRLGYLFVKNFLQWDSWWFTEIASKGYWPKATAFFPLYPLLIRAVSEVLRISTGAAAILISTVCFVVGLYFFLRLVRLDLDRKRAVRALLVLVLFPTAFYFSVGYTESLFLLLTVLALYALRRGRWAIAGVWGGLAAVARNTGVALGLPFLIEYFQQWRKRPRPRPHPWGALWVLLIGVGTAAYFVYLWVRFGSPLVFVHAESEYGRGRLAPWMTLYEGFKYNVGFFGDLRFGIHQQWVPVYYTTQLLFPAAALIVLITSFRKMRWSYWVIVLYSIVVPLMAPANGQVIDYFVGFSRYMLVVVPLFLGIERLLRWRWLLWTYLVLSTLLLLVYTWAFSGHRVVA